MTEDDIIRRYSQFVNRDAELKRFCRILDEKDYVVMVIHGESGIGKTALQKRLIYECREVRKMRFSETSYLDTRTYNYMTIMRKIRDDLDPSGIAFQAFTDLLNYFTKPDYDLKINITAPAATGNASILNGATLDQTEIKEVIGQKIVIQDFNINTPREDKTIREEERMYKLTQQFLTDLAGALGDQNLVVLIDDLEKMPLETNKWLWSEFVRSILDRGLANIRFVFCIDTEPQLKDDELKAKVRVGNLKLLSEEHILEYLNKRKVADEVNRIGLAQFIMAQSGGKPATMAQLVETFITYQKNKEDQ